MVSTNDHNRLPSAIPDPLRERLGTDASVALESYVGATVQFQLQEIFDRFELRSTEHLHDELGRLKHELKQDLKEGLAEIRRDMSIMKVEVRQEFTTALLMQKADIMKWMFTFWIGQAAVTVGLILAVK